MWHKIANFILRNRFLIIGIITLLTVFFGYYAAFHMKLENKYGFVLPKDSPTTKNYKHFKDMFGEDGGTLVFAIQTDSLYTERNFLKWKALGDTILQFDGVESVISEATLFTIRNNTTLNTFEAERIFSDVTFKEKSIDSIRKEIKHNPVYRGLLYNDSSNVSLMMVSIDERFLSDQKKSKIVLDIENLTKEFEPYFGKFRFAGLPHMRVVIAKRIQQEMYLFIGLSLLVTSILIYIFFRSLRVVFISLTIVAITVIWAIGSMAFLEFRLSILMALIPPLMIVIGVPNCTYLITKYHQEIREHGNKIRALTRVIQKIGTATFLTNLTTAVGFSTFAFTNSEKLMEFGIAASVNVMMVFVISITILPIIVSFSKAPKERHLKHLDRKFATGMIRGILFLTEKKRPWIYASTLLIIIIAGIGISSIKATGNLTGDLPKDDPILKDVQFIEKHFGGSIPFEMMINYKEKGRLFKKSTLEKVESIQAMYAKDTLFSRSISLVDFIKVINMAYYQNDPSHYELISNRDKIRLKKYIDNFDMTSVNGGSISVKELVDTMNTTMRIRCQMKDIGSYEQAEKVDHLKVEIDEILNPDKKELTRLFTEVERGKDSYIDSILDTYTSVQNNLTSILSKNNQEKQLLFDSDPSLLRNYYKNPEFKSQLKDAIEMDYFDVTITGTSVIASEGTRYLVNNLFSSLLFAILIISLLMAILFRSWRMVVISMVPNFIPLLVTGGLMGYFQIPLKPSTLLVFSIALGISVDDTIHFLAKYRQEIKSKKWNLKDAVLISIKETGLGMFYTSIVLFCGFSVFNFSQFGGTQALGLLISITLLIAMITNLLILPSLLLSLDKLIVSKSFKEPYFDSYTEESEIDWSELQLSTTEDLEESDTTKDSTDQSNV